MYCTGCGAKLPDDANFCTNCGTPVDAVTRAALSAVARPAADADPWRDEAPWDAALDSQPNRAQGSAQAVDSVQQAAAHPSPVQASVPSQQADGKPGIVESIRRIRRTTLAGVPTLALAVALALAMVAVAAGAYLVVDRVVVPIVEQVLQGDGEEEEGDVEEEPSAEDAAVVDAVDDAADNDAAHAAYEEVLRQHQDAYDEYCAYVSAAGGDGDYLTYLRSLGVVVSTDEAYNEYIDAILNSDDDIDGAWDDYQLRLEETAGTFLDQLSVSYSELWLDAAASYLDYYDSRYPYVSGVHLAEQWVYYADGSLSVLYCLLDLDGDGVDELLVGYGADVASGAEYIDIYTYSDGEVVALSADTYRSQRASVCEDGTIRVVGSGSAFGATIWYYTLDGGGLSECDYLYYYDWLATNAGEYEVVYRNDGETVLEGTFANEDEGDAFVDELISAIEQRHVVAEVEWAVYGEDAA